MTSLTADPPGQSGGQVNATVVGRRDGSGLLWHPARADGTQRNAARRAPSLIELVVVS
jgi:hypothetical protein